MFSSVLETDVGRFPFPSGFLWIITFLVCGFSYFKKCTKLSTIVFSTVHSKVHADTYSYGALKGKGLCHI